jgi:putative phosphoesterase
LKIGILSDIHIDINKNERDMVTPAICNVIREKSLDILLIAGDVASDYKLVLAALKRIENEGAIPCLYVPGNHDVWTENYPKKTSWQIYDLLKSYSNNLSNGPYIIDKNWVVIGDLGWYDFSFGDSKYNFEDFSKMKYEERVWQDSIKAVWDRSTLDMHKYFLEKLENQLNQYSDKNVILVTHVLPIKDFTVQAPSPMWEYMNAFLGSKQYGELILRHQNIKYAVSGHVHYRKQLKIKNTEFLCNCLGYSSEWNKNTDAAVEVDRAMGIIAI